MRQDEILETSNAVIFPDCASEPQSGKITVPGETAFRVISLSRLMLVVKSQFIKAAI
ncbi:hypothetical protein QUF75_01315 [Desulfococcaceae bacterium HSG7]|nr:hypothetical protein [Desulfococcaceae bacterium HSG7]